MSKNKEKSKAAGIAENVVKLSPLRNSTTATTIEELVAEQLAHFSIDPASEFGKTIAQMAFRIYECEGSVDELWHITQDNIQNLQYKDRVALFNAKKFLSFQLAKVLDSLQNPFRKSYQSLRSSNTTRSAKSAYSIFDNVTAIFSATPVITRTATYTYACAEWIADAFQGKELMLEIYSRLLNPTSIALANHIVDLEAGAESQDYLAWNFNSGMAAIDATLSHVLGYEDVLITSRNIYGGAHQLINDWYAKPSNFNVAVETFEGETADGFLSCWRRVKEQYAKRLFGAEGEHKSAYVYLESPCNPHGYILDVPAICKAAHKEGLRVILDATVGTPFLHRPLTREDPAERPDFLIHSYTKDLSGNGTVIAGCVIGHNQDMFIAKGDPGWDQTLFWNVYYVKGAFLTADAAFEVLAGMRTLEMRMLNKCINTQILANFLAAHPMIQVNCNALATNHNAGLRNKLMFLGLPAPLFTIEMPKIPLSVFQRFFDCLEPHFSHMISLGQTNTIVSCPGLTTHSELNEKEQRQAEIYPNTIRFALGNENPKDLIRHFVEVAKLVIDEAFPGFSDGFLSMQEIDELIKNTYIDTHTRYITANIK
jgi:O-acetylhomoserine (thiol)-lyase